MPLLTSTIGAYPKPDYAPVQGWYERRYGHQDNPTGAYSDYLRQRSAESEAAFDRATEEAVRDQVAAGIDIPTDGEVRREHYIYYHLRHVDGFDFEELTDQVMREGAWRARVPTVVGQLSAGSPFLAEDWRKAQAATDCPVKITVPGPLTIIDSTADAFYGDPRRLAMALADALNVEIRRLAEAGCQWIQVDEPVFARQPQRALDFGIEALARCFHEVPGRTRRVVHICCGYPAKLDDEDYAKADRGAYGVLADALDAAPVDAISLEDAHRHNDLALLERFATSSILLGVVGIARTRVEPVEEIRTRLLDALEHIDPHRLIAAPDCGLIMLSRDLARAKLETMAKAAKSIGV